MSVIVTLRMEEDVRDKLQELAKIENRSLNNLICTILMRYLDKMNEKEKEHE